MSAARKPRNVLPDGRRHLALKSTMAWLSDPEATQAMWDNGYRPLTAEQIIEGDVVLARQSMFGFASGPSRPLRVFGVKRTEFCVLIDLGSTDEAEVDECDEVWTKAANT